MNRPIQKIKHPRALSRKPAIRVSPSSGWPYSVVSMSENLSLAKHNHWEAHRYMSPNPRVQTASSLIDGLGSELGHSIGNVSR